jgi:Phage gp6-like head-tail connector protein
VLSPYALVSLAELKDHIGAGGNAKDAQLEEVINRVSDELESYLEREIVSRGALTEYHTMQADGLEVLTPDLRTLEWPILSVTSAHEDTTTPRSYGSGALLVAGTGYEVVKPRGLIRRLEGGAGTTRTWATGHRAVKVVYTAGYADTAAVPARIRGVALRYAAVVWDEMKRQSFGVSGAADSLGNFTRFAPAQLTNDMKAAVMSERRLTLWDSGERDS